MEIEGTLIVLVLVGLLVLFVLFPHRLPLQIGSHLAFRVGSVLADHHECGEEDRLDRRFHGQNDERWVEMRDAGDQVPGDPDAVYHQMQINKPHASGECGDGIGQLFFSAGVTLLLFASFP